MPLVTYEALCIDADDIAKVHDFWADTLGFELERLDDDDDVHLREMNLAKRCGSTRSPSR